MRPLHLVMDGFGVFRELTEVDFTDIDLVALTGDTGAGKSTIIDAITFALYGEVARYGDARLVAPAINQTSQQAKVMLDFELGSHRYTAVRVVRRTKNGATTREARLERDDEVLASDAAGMTKAVQELLGLTADQFNRTVVLPQGRFADFLHDKPSDRQETLRKLLGLEMYQRIGAAAWARAAVIKVEIGVLQPDVDTRSAELTDQRRSDLLQTIAALTEARITFDRASAQLRDLQAERDAAMTEAEQIDEHTALLAAVEAPPGVDALDAAVRVGRDELEAASAALDVARSAARAAAQALEAGPNEAAVRLQLALHDDVTELTADHGQLERELADASSAADVAAEEAARVRSEQATLDARVDESRCAEQVARDELAGLPSLPQIDAWLETHRRLADATAAAVEADASAAIAIAALAPLAQRRATALAAANRAEEALSDARQRAGIAAYASMLAVGRACPLCLQEVHTVATHAVDDQVRTAEQAHVLVTVALDAAEGDWTAADVVRRDAAALMVARQRTLDSCVAEAASLDTVDVLHKHRASITALNTAAQAAAAACRLAESAAADHRSSSSNRAVLDAADSARRLADGLSAKQTTVRSMLDSKRGQLDGALGRAELTMQLTEAARLRDESKAAADALEHAGAESVRANTAAQQAQQQVDAGRHALQDARHWVATLMPPPLPRDSLAEAWQMLTEWATARSVAFATRRTSLATRLDEISRGSAAVHDSMLDCCVTVLGALRPGTTTAEIDTALTRRHTEAEMEVKAFDQQREELHVNQQRLEALVDEAAVAAKLAHLLRADGFEGWLMEEALEHLVDRATERLHELSGGQYSLELVDRSFSVRDHTNADELRNVKTLSGGETFLASLALALALADATAALAPDGAPDLESIFLDEGFGTLDPQTLDAVASAIEELGASGRLVGVITHIRELAERMPVRLEVTKTGGMSRVTRVDT